MPDAKFFEGYGGQSTEDLLGLSPSYRTDSLVLAFEQALDQKAARVGMAALTPEERVVLAIEAFEREVNNGGYAQFFGNSSGEFVGDIAQSLETIGCPNYAEVTRRAIAALEINGKPTPEQIEAALDAGGESLQAALEACDNAFFAVRSEDVAERLFSFVRQRKEHVCVP